jgi:hypothetical protein
VTRRRKPGQPRKTGPKRVFTNEQLDNLELLAKLGATNGQIASFFDVKENLIDYWLKHHKDFAEARRKGGLEADMKVVQSLYKRALGYSYEEVEFIRAKGKEDFVTKITKKQLAPDVKAIIHWLGARQRENWTLSTQFHMNHNHSGKVEHMHNRLEDIPIHELSKATQDMLFEVGVKQMSNGDRDN